LCWNLLQVKWTPTLARIAYCSRRLARSILPGKSGKWTAESPERRFRLKTRKMDACAAIEKAASSATNRHELWSFIVNQIGLATIAEVGIFKGEFAHHILSQCPTVEKYYMIDPWRHLDDWNKPFNRTNEEFARIREEAIARTAFASGKRVILQGKTAEVSCELPDRGLDLAYLDGDHTLRGITIDLVQVSSRMRNGGVLGGDDFFVSIWGHGPKYEPTLVFPMAVYFAEAIGSIIYGLPFDQFAIVVNHADKNTHQFRDLTGTYKTTTLCDALREPKRGLAQEMFHIAKTAFRRMLGR
jgi:hypothetical protein